MGIKSIYSDSEGTKLVFMDDHGQGFIFLPVSVDSDSHDSCTLVSTFRAVKNRR